MTALWTEYWNISRHSGKYKNIFCAQTSDGRWIVAESKQKTSFMKFIISLLGRWHTFKDDVEWSAIEMSILYQQPQPVTVNKNTVDVDTTISRNLVVLIS